MSVCDYLVIGEKVELEIVEEDKKTKLPVVIKGVEDESIVVKLPDLLRYSGKIGRGTQVKIVGKKGDVDFRISTKVVEEEESSLIKLTPMKEAVQTEKRHFLRVEGSLPCTYTVLSEDEYEEAQREHLNRHADKSGVQTLLSKMWHHEREGKDNTSETDRAIVQLLIDIDRKLNILLDSFDPHGRRTKKGKDATVVDISGSGAKISCSEELETGKILKLELVLPTFPVTPVTVFGEVLRVDNPESDSDSERNYVVVNFTIFNEDDRDSIIRYIFQKQREILRSTKEQYH
ncbi:MAG: PilZ domain-containing protein [Pseudomonadota bacterium]